MTKETIQEDLNSMLRKYGVEFLILLCSMLIYEHQWYNWNEMKKEIYLQLNEPMTNE